MMRVQNSVYFNNAEDYLSAIASTTTMLVGLGSDCGVFFAQSHNAGTTSTIRAIRKQTVALIQERSSNSSGSRS